MPRSVSPLLLLLASSLILPLRAQTSADANPAQASTLQVETRAVVLEVVVTTANDESVKDLRQEHFQVTEDGVPQSVLYFEEHTATTAPPIQPTLLPPNVFTNLPTLPPGEVVNLLLVDILNTLREDQTAVRDQLIAYLKKMPPGEPLAIFALGSKLRLVQGFTSDPATLLAAVLDKNTGVWTRTTLMSRTSENTAYEKQTPEAMAEIVPGDVGINAQIESSAAIADVRQAQQDRGNVQAEQRIATTATALQFLARYLANIPGRKNLVWFASSFPRALFPNAGNNGSLLDDEQNKQLKQTADLLAASQVAVYPVAARGVETQVWNDPVVYTHLTVGTTAQEDYVRTENLAAMAALASETGGEVIAGTNDMGKALSRAIQNGSHYYTLSYTPTNKVYDGKFRRIDVKLLGDKFNLAYRRGYYAFDTTTATATATDPLLPLLHRGLPSSTQLVYDVRVQPANPQPTDPTARAGGNQTLPGPLARYSADFTIRWSNELRERTPPAPHTGKLRVELIAVDHQGKPLNWAGSSLDLSFKDTDYAAIQKSGIPAHLEIDLPKGDVYLETGVYDWTSNKAGTLEIPLNVLKSLAISPMP